MKIRALTFGDRETRDEVQIPETVTVEMSIEEAVILADIAGSVIGAGQQQTSTLIWNGLVPLINQTWEDGTAEAVRDLGLHRWLFKAGTRDYG